MHKTNPKESSGLTLTELLLAVAMVGGIVLAVVAIDVSARRFLLSTAYESKTQNEASPVLEYIIKDVTKAIGNINAPGIVVDPSGNWIRVRHLNRNPLDEFEDHSDDNWVEYLYNPTDYTIRRKECGADSTCSAVLSSVKFGQNIIGCQFSLTNYAQVAISITAKKDADPASKSNPNPEVVLQAKAVSREQSLK